MNIVFVLDSYYPKYAAVGKCLSNIIEVLENDYNVVVICLKNSTYQESSEILNKHRIIRTNTKINKFRVYVEESINKSNGIKRIIFDFILFLIRIYSLLKVLISKNTLNKKLCDSYIKELNNLETNIDVIIPTCSPFESVVAALEYKKTHNEVIVIPFLFDLFTYNSSLNRFRWNMDLKKRENMKLEEEMFKLSKKIFCVSNWRNHINQNFGKYKYKTVEVEHPLLRDNREKCELKKISILCINAKNEKVEEYNNFKEYISNYYNKTLINFNDSIELSETVDIKEFSLLIVFPGDNYINISEIITKFILAGRPIIYFKNDNDAIVNLLSKYDLKLILPKRLKGDKELILKFINDSNNKLVSFENVKKNYLIQGCYNNFINILKNNYKMNKFSLVFAGSLIKGYVEAKYVISLFSNQMENFTLDFYSSGSATRDVINANSDTIHLKGWMTKEELKKIYENTDGFISIAEKEGMQISSKIFEYMSTGKPIIHFYYTDVDRNLKYLEQYPNSLCIKVSQNSLDFERKRINLFMSFRKQEVFNFENNELLNECTPKFIGNLIKKELY